jgi:hypothetical protein
VLKMLDPPNLSEIPLELVREGGGEAEPSVNAELRAARQAAIAEMFSWWMASRFDVSRPTICLRLASCWSLLEKGLLPRARLDPGPSEWAPLLIHEVAYAGRSKAGSLMVEVRFLVLDGKWGGLIVPQRLAYNWLRYDLAVRLGWPRFGKRANKNELVLCGLVGEVVVPAVGRPGIGQFEVPGAAVKHNKWMRHRRTQPCPREYTWPCHECTVGHDAGAGEVKECERATHPRTLVLRPCKVGGAHEGWFDPDDAGDRCIGCRMRPLRGAISQLEFEERVR